MIKQIQIQYCDFCQKESNDCIVIKIPIKENNEIIVADKDICNDCCEKLINLLINFPPTVNEEPQQITEETIEETEQIIEDSKIETSSATITPIISPAISPADITLAKQRDEVLASYIIHEKDKIPLLNKPYNASLIEKYQYPPTKIFLGGLSHNKSLAITLKECPPFILDSLLEFPQSFTPLTEKYFQWIKDNNIEFFLDSGAFSYLNNPKKEINLINYIERYIKFIKHYNIKKYFELDLDHMIGLDAVNVIREYLYQQTGIIPIPVWHKSRGREEWTNLCKNYDFIAIGGIASKEIKPSEAIKLITELCDEAHAYNTKVHGLGFALLELLNNYTMPCDTIDTSSWNKSRRAEHCMLIDGKIIVKNGTVSYDSKINNINDLKVWGDFSRFYIKHNFKGE